MLKAERKTLIVIILTLITMIAEIIVGYYTNSMALFADGWHMGTHVLALMLTFVTYMLIRKFADTKTFVFGTGKFSTLSGYTSSILLGLTGVFIIYESVERFINPLDISFNEAILVAIIGLVVNSLCILIMGDNDHCHNHCIHEHEDFNFKAAYMHIAADAMTSIFAIVALITAKSFGWIFLDPIVGIIGGTVICIWAYGLIKSTSMILLDAEVKEVKSFIEALADFTELHVWRTSDEKYSIIGKVNSDIDKDLIKNKIREKFNTNLIYIETI